MEKNSAANLLTSIDSLFTTQQERDLAAQPRVEEISLDLIDDFPDHPFKVRMDESMTEMADSVKQYGVLVPAIVRQKEDGRYEMVAGHRRKAACELAGKTKIPCVVRDLTLEEAVWPLPTPIMAISASGRMPLMVRRKGGISKFWMLSKR